MVNDTDMIPESDGIWLLQNLVGEYFINRMYALHQVTDPLLELVRSPNNSLPAKCIRTMFIDYV